MTDEELNAEGKMKAVPIDEPTCGFCGLPGCDKVPHPVRWPGEESPGSKYVHAVCEDTECRRAHAALSDRERAEFLRGLRREGR